MDDSQVKVIEDLKSKRALVELVLARARRRNEIRGSINLLCSVRRKECTTQRTSLSRYDGVLEVLQETAVHIAHVRFPESAIRSFTVCSATSIDLDRGRVL